MHNVDIQNDNDNWSRWGTLVDSWIGQTLVRPTNLAGLRAAMTTVGVNGTVEGAAGRGVTFVGQDDAIAQPLIIALPTAAMINADERLLDAIAAKPPGQRRYPLPTFYAVAFGGVPMVDLTKPQLLAMARRRLGEYVINECM